MKNTSKISKNKTMSYFDFFSFFVSVRSKILQRIVIFYSLLCWTALSLAQTAPISEATSNTLETSASSDLSQTTSNTIATSPTTTRERRTFSTFTVEVETSNEEVQETLLRHLEIQHYKELPDLDRIELDRLLVAAHKNVRELLATMGYFSSQIEIVVTEMDSPSKSSSEEQQNAQQKTQTDLANLNQENQNPSSEQIEPNSPNQNPSNTNNNATKIRATSHYLVKVLIDLGLPVRVSEVDIRFKGLHDETGPHLEQTAIHSAWSLRAGDIFQQNRWDHAKTEALRLLTAHRYPTGKISHSLVDIDPEKHEAKLLVELDLGAEYRFGDVEVEGLERYQPELVQRLAQLPKGELYNQTKLLQAQQRVADSGYFDSVFMTIDTDENTDPQAATLRVKVREAKLKKWVLGVGGSTDAGPRLSAEFKHQQIPWLGWRATNKLSLDKKIQNINTELLSQPDDKHWSWIAGGELQRRIVDDLPVYSQRLRFGKRQTQEQYDRSIFAQFDHARTHGASLDSGSALSMNYAWTKRNFDNLSYPKSGSGLAAQLGGGVTLGNQKTPFIRTWARWLNYQPLSFSEKRADQNELDYLARQSRLVWRLEGGAVIARENNTLPSTQLFLTGGDNTVRGYGFQSIGATQQTKTISAGRYLSVGSLELQRPIVWNNRVTEWDHTLFIDAGSVADRVNQLKPQVGIGTGARWRSPVGPMQIDLAWGAKVKRFRLHVNVGFNF